MSGAAGTGRTPRAVWIVLAVLGALVVAGLVAWPLGGWDTVTPSSARIPALHTGQLHRGAQLATRIEGAEVGPAYPDGRTPLHGGRVLTVTALVEDLDDAPATATDLAATIVVPGLTAALGDPDIRVASDGTSMGDLGPSVPTRLTLSWRVRTGAYRAGSELELRVIDRRPVESVLSVGTRWVDPRVAALWHGTLAAGPPATPDDAAFGGSGS